jgi:hypothetical protein
MPLVPLPVDFVAIRAAIVAVLATATGLPESQVIFEQPETFDAPRPAYPYVGVTVLQASMQMGPDFYLAKCDAPDAPTGLFSYTGTRQMDVTFDTYAKTHETAYNVAAIIQARLMQIPTRDMFRASGLVVNSVGGVSDVSELLNTFYEGRAQVDVSFGFVTAMDVDMGRMDTFEIASRVAPNPDETYTLEEP